MLVTIPDLQILIMWIYQHPMLHRNTIAYANQQSEWIAHRMLISIGTYWAMYDWFAQLGHTLPCPILANWLILSPSCRCSSVSGTCVHWVGQEKSELNIKNIFKPISGGIGWIRHWKFGLPFFFAANWPHAQQKDALTEHWTQVTPLNKST